MKPFYVIELNLSNIRHVDDRRSLLLRRFKLLSPFGKSFLLPFELFVSSFFIVMKNIVHQAEFYLNFIKLDVIILNHSILLFQIQNILTKELEEDLLTQDVIILPNRELFLEQVGKHWQKEGLPTILLLLERIWVVKSAYLKGVYVLKNIKFFQSVLQPHISVVTRVHGLVQWIRITLRVCFSRRIYLNIWRRLPIFTFPEVLFFVRDRLLLDPFFVRDVITVLISRFAIRIEIATTMIGVTTSPAITTSSEPILRFFKVPPVFICRFLHIKIQIFFISYRD